MIPTRYARHPLDPYLRRSSMPPTPSDLATMSAPIPGPGSSAYLPALLERKLHLDTIDPRGTPSPPLTRMRPPLQRPPSIPSPTSSDTRSLEEATKDLMTHMDSHKDEISRCLSSFRGLGMRNGTMKSYVQDIFEVFDRYVFMGRLSGRVEFHGYGHVGKEKVLGVSESGKTLAAFAGRRRANVVLNCEMFEMLVRARGEEAFDVVVAAVVHQMIHAYFLVVCGGGGDEKKEEELLGHEHHFGLVMYKIRERWGVHAPPLPIDFGNTMPEVAERYLPPFDPYDTAGFRMQSESSSKCAKKVKKLKEDDCKEWYKEKCLKKLDPDVFVYSSSTQSFETKAFSKCGKKDEWVELIHKKKSYKVARKALDKFPTFKKRFEDSVRKLDVSSEVKKETLEDLVRYLSEEHAFSLPALRDLIELYRLASDLKFDELKEEMMDTIHHASKVNESDDIIIDAMRAAYGRAPIPDDSLRQWAINYLVEVGNTAISLALHDPRLSRLRSISPPFKCDVARANNEMARVVGQMRALAAGTSSGVNAYDVYGASQGGRQPQIAVTASLGAQFARNQGYEAISYPSNLPFPSESWPAGVDIQRALREELLRQNQMGHPRGF